MTATQTLRYERRRIALERRQQALKDAIVGILAGLLILIAFGIAGSMEYPDEQHEVDQWAERGITVVRDW